jgi:hypothetical protein
MDLTVASVGDDTARFSLTLYSMAALAATRATTMAPWIIALVPGVSCMYLSFPHSLARAA